MFKTHQQATKVIYEKVIYEMDRSIQIKLAKINKKGKPLEKHMMLKTHQHVGE